MRLADRFGDDGLVGGCVTQAGPDGTRTVTLLMMSCRAMGRGVIEALLAWLARSAARGGASALGPCRAWSAQGNVPLRLALTSPASGRAIPAGLPGQRDAVFSRPLSGPLPEVPSWVTAPGAAAR